MYELVLNEVPDSGMKLSKIVGALDVRLQQGKEQTAEPDLER